MLKLKKDHPQQEFWWVGILDLKSPEGGEWVKQFIIN